MGEPVQLLTPQQEEGKKIEMLKRSFSQSLLKIFGKEQHSARSFSFPSCFLLPAGPHPGRSTGRHPLFFLPTLSLTTPTSPPPPSGSRARGWEGVGGTLGSLRLLEGLGRQTWVQQAKCKPHPPFFCNYRLVKPGLGFACNRSHTPTIQSFFPTALKINETKQDTIV